VLDPGFEEFLSSCHNGFDGTKITRELGFQYEHTDIEEALTLMAEAAIAAGIVKPGMMIEARGLIAIVVLSALILSAGCFMCACKRKVD